LSITNPHQLQIMSHEELMVTKDMDSFVSDVHATEASDGIGGLLHFPRHPSAHVRDAIGMLQLFSPT